LSGYNTRWAELALDRLLPTSTDSADVSGQVLQQAVLWTVWFGANDAAISDTSAGMTHVPLYEYENNLKSLLTKIKQSSSGPVQIIVLTPPPIDANKYAEWCREKFGAQASEPASRTDEWARRYAAAAVRAATSCGAEVIDVYSAMHSSGQPVAEFLSDGLHLNQAGNQLVYDLLVKVIDERFSWLKVVPDPFTGSFHNSGSRSSLAHEFPWHDAIDAEDPAKAFNSI